MVQHSHPHMTTRKTFSTAVATAEFSQFAGILSTAPSQHHFSRFEIAQRLYNYIFVLAVIIILPSRSLQYMWMLRCVFKFGTVQKMMLSLGCQQIAAFWKALLSLSYSVTLRFLEFCSCTVSSQAYFSCCCCIFSCCCCAKNSRSASSFLTSELQNEDTCHI